ncbi:hypothetical protein [Kitasatospora sp. NPDC094011]|uniref:hypothetical protein n=1 Tax=Kitasatospora sp. NPDC094011 TaxID=3364090 RepID=UPI00380DC7E3
MLGPRWRMVDGRRRRDGAGNALHGIRPVTEGLGRFQGTDAAAAERRQSRLAALAVATDASPIPVVNP